MSRTLARQKIQAATDAMRCAQSNIAAAAAHLGDDHDARMTSAVLNLMAIACEEILKGARDALDGLTVDSTAARELNG